MANENLIEFKTLYKVLDTDVHVLPLFIEASENKKVAWCILSADDRDIPESRYMLSSLKCMSLDNAMSFIYDFSTDSWSSEYGAKISVGDLQMQQILLMKEYYKLIAAFIKYNDKHEKNYKLVDLLNESLEKLKEQKQ